ncbi:MAG: acyloxyacyl hydrolase [Candidatus Omnitrophica bacterium]|nr:acyloxyacyl hydrolase [Candidatus Omnitrophota bacterium]
MGRISILIFVFVFSLSLCAFASDLQNEKESQKWSFPYVHEIGVFTGFAMTKLEEQGDYEIVPAQLRLGYNLNSVNLGFCDLFLPIFRKFNIKPKGFTEFLFESFANTVIGPDNNVEAGCTILLKYSYPLTEKIYPYALSGGGVAYISQDTREQSLQWGFTPQSGVGISYLFKKDTALNMEYRYRHFSNADIKKPNEGINVSMFLVGVSLFY